MKTQIKGRFHLVNGQLIKKSNMAKLRMESMQLCTNFIHPRIDPKTYHELYIVIKGPRGYAWKEVTHGAGGGGWKKSLRELVLTTIYGFCGGHLRVFVSDEPLDIEAIQRGWDEHDADMRRRYPQEKRADWSDGARAIQAPKAIHA